MARHTCCNLGFWYVMMEDDDIERELGVSCTDDVITCDVPYGGFLLFNNLTVHRRLVEVACMCV